MTTICVCLLLGVPEVHTKCQLSDLSFFLFQHFHEGLKVVCMSVGLNIFVNTDRLDIQECHRPSHCAKLVGQVPGPSQ